jgi:deazaflavin-dependent oxidoreductase (nitroreductase family)
MAEDLKAGTRGATGVFTSRRALNLVRRVHVPLYRWTGGMIGYRIGKQTMLLLTVIGAKSGLRRTTALNYEADGDNFIVVASQGGRVDHPLWYKNLVKNPEVEVQVKRSRVKCRARTATKGERPRLWQLMTTNYRGYIHYQESTDREIPLVILEPIAE